jgi:hypothetical protein
LEFCDGDTRLNTILWALDQSPAWAGAIFAWIVNHLPGAALSDEVAGWECGNEERELYNSSVDRQAYLLAVLQSSRDGAGLEELVAFLQDKAQKEGVELPSNGQRVAVVEEVCHQAAAAMLAWLQLRLAA